jgi:hypothetical protein
MKVRVGTGWQTLFADLSIILFMVTAAAVSERSEPPAASAQGTPLALYRAETGAPPLADWLAAQSADPRQQLSIVAHYPPGGQGAALTQARALLDQAGAAGLAARLVVEPGAGGITAALAYDDPLAQDLQNSPANLALLESKP